MIRGRFRDHVRRHYPRFIAFMGRRFAIGEYLGLHLTLGLCLSLVLLGLFIIVARNIGTLNDGEHIDNWLGPRLARYRDAPPALTGFFLGITFLGSIYAIVPIVMLTAILLLWRRRLYLALIWLFAQAGGGLLDQVLKLSFDRDRPPFRYDLAMTSKSFPSGHSMGSIVCYGLLAYLLVRVLHGRIARSVTLVVLTTLILAIGYSRLYLGVHWFTDVIGGYAVGAFWLATCISAIETIRRRPTRDGKDHMAHHSPQGDTVTR